MCVCVRREREGETERESVASPDRINKDFKAERNDGSGILHNVQFHAMISWEWSSR